MSKQTAVEWLEKEIRKQLHVDIKHTTIGVKLFEEAKAMEKEQIINAYNNGDLRSGDLRSVDLYYNETYGGDK